MRIINKNFLKRLVIIAVVMTLFTTGVSLLPSVTACPVGMVSCWKLDEMTGTTAFDAIDGNHGTLSCCPLWTPFGKVNTALWFDGNDDKVVVPDSSSLHFSSFTVMAWAKAEGKFGSWRTILTKDRSGQSEFWFGYASNNKLDFKFNGVSGFNINDPAQQVITDTGWHFLVGVYDGTNIMVYVDGVLDASKPYGPMTVGTGTLNMGITLFWGDNAFLGVLDEVAVFDIALTPAEIMSYYNMGKSGHSYCAQPPVADANGPYVGGAGEVINFDGSGSYDPDGTIVSYQWDFGDGHTDTGVAPSHTYKKCGVYPVTLLVTDNDGLTDTDQTTATISPTHPAVDKTVWDGSAWVDDIRVTTGAKLNFRIQITNTEKCPMKPFTVTDYLSLPQLKYEYESNMIPISASDNEVRWQITTLNPGETIEITYNASAVHVCYGWNSVYVKDYRGTVIGYDLTKVKVVEAGQPVLAISTLVWDDRTHEWSDQIGHTLNKALTFKTTVSSTALSTVHDVTVTDILPALIAYNYDATPTPDTASDNEVIWNLGDLSPGDEREITYTVTTQEMGLDHTTATVTSTEGYSDENYVLLDIDSAPTMSLLYPVGGETLKDSVIIQWHAEDIKDGDNLMISLYYKNSHDTLWTAFPYNPSTNTGELTWDTTNVADGSYQIQIATQDSNNNVVNVISNKFQIKNTETSTENLAPDTPGAPSGDAQGKPGQTYTYTASTIDPEDDQVYYLWDWGDGIISEWLGPYNSGETISVTHTWTAKGSYSITVKAQDIYGHESSWSDPLPITMPYTYTPLQQFLASLFQRFPHAFPILRQLLGY